jgi:hypothetical protein
MKYYIDTEFLEGAQSKKLLGITYGQTKPLIDLISIGIVGEDNREYYAISKDFNLKEAWNRYDLVINKQYPLGPEYNKVYWIRENVLRPIFVEWRLKANAKIIRLGLPIQLNVLEFNYKNFKYCIKCIGKTNKQIAEEIKEFTYVNLNHTDYNNINSNIQFYGYYADYDWVVFCWLFGNMIDLPDGFPMYCIDLKQEFDKKITSLSWLYLRDTWNNSRMSVKTIGKGDNQEKDRLATFEEKTKRAKELEEYPKQTNEHHALEDAIWSKKLHEFVNKI